MVVGVRYCHKQSGRKLEPRPSSNLYCLLIDKKAIEERRREEEWNGGGKNRSQMAYKYRVKNAVTRCHS